jgi:hypothetical protein
MKVHCYSCELSSLNLCCICWQILIIAQETLITRKFKLHVSNMIFNISKTLPQFEAQLLLSGISCHTNIFNKCMRTARCLNIVYCTAVINTHAHGHPHPKFIWKQENLGHMDKLLITDTHSEEINNLTCHNSVHSTLEMAINLFSCLLDSMLLKFYFIRHCAISWFNSLLNRSILHAKTKYKNNCSAKRFHKNMLANRKRRTRGLMRPHPDISCYTLQSIRSVDKGWLITVFKE